MALHKKFNFIEKELERSVKWGKIGWMTKFKDLNKNCFTSKCCMKNLFFIQISKLFYQYIYHNNGIT